MTVISRRSRSTLLVISCTLYRMRQARICCAMLFSPLCPILSTWLSPHSSVGILMPFSIQTWTDGIIHLMPVLRRGVLIGRVLPPWLAATQTFPVWRIPHPRDTTFSWDHPSGRFSSRIDMIWAPMCLNQCIMDCQYHTSFFPTIATCCSNSISAIHLREVRGCGSLTPLCLTIRSIVLLLGLFGPSGRPRRLGGQGKFFLCEVTHIFACAHAGERSKLKLDLERRLRVLQGFFGSGDSSAFSELCAIQEELHTIHLHEAKALQVQLRCW